jgi:hypothetical protein
VAVSIPPVIPDLPSPMPQRGTMVGKAYSDAADAFMAALPSRITLMNSGAQSAYNNALQTSSDATLTAADRLQTALDRTQTALDSAAAVGAAAIAQGFKSTSTTSNTIGTGVKTFNIGTNLQFTNNTPILVVDQASAANWMYGTGTYVAASGVLTLTATDFGGSGTKTAWNVSVSGIKGPAGSGFVGGKLSNKLEYTSRATIAAAATTNIGGAATNSILVSGSGITITSFGAGGDGQLVAIEFGGANTLTHSAALELPGQAAITTATGDKALALSTAAGWTLLSYQRASGQVAHGAVLSRTAAYTTTANDSGLTIEYTGAGGVNLTLGALAAPVQTYWKIGLRNDSTGIITIVGTLDGKTNVRVYPGEAFTIYASGANFKSLGRSKRVLVSDIDVTGLSTILIEAVFGDPELAALEFDFNQIVTGGSYGSIGALLKYDGAYMTYSQAYVSWTSAGANYYNQSRMVLSVGSSGGGVPVQGSLRMPNPLSGAGNALNGIMQTNQGVIFGGAMWSPSPGVVSACQGIQFVASGTAFGSGRIRTYLERA